MEIPFGISNYLSILYKGITIMKHFSLITALCLFISLPARSSEAMHPVPISKNSTFEQQYEFAEFTIHCSVTGAFLDYIGKKQESLEMKSFYNSDVAAIHTPLLTGKDWNDIYFQGQYQFNDSTENRVLLMDAYHACLEYARLMQGKA